MNNNIQSRIGCFTKRVVFGASILAMMLYDVSFSHATTRTDANSSVSSVMVQPQDERKVVVTGKVVDSDRNPILRANVRIVGTRIKTTTTAEGDFTINVNIGDILEFSAAGFSLKEMPIDRDTKSIFVNLEIEESTSVDLRDVAYGKQESASIVGAISTVSGDKITYSNSNLTPGIIGNVSGVMGITNSGAPGVLKDNLINNEIYIRGIRSMIDGIDVTPLILMDGIEINELDLARINPEEVDNISILKDASATAPYGARGANGVILITTKTSTPGEINISANYEQVWASPTMQPEFIDPVSYMNFYNTAIVNGGNTTAELFSQDKISRTASGLYDYFAYPANDWNEQLFMPTTKNSRLSVNVSGGTKTIQYFTAFTMNDDMGMINSDEFSVFNANIENKMMSFRANMVANLNKGIKLTINSYTTIDEYQGPQYRDEYEEVSSLYIGDNIYSLAYGANPVTYPMIFPSDGEFDWDHIRFGDAGSIAKNPYMRIHEGFTTADRYFTVNKFSYDQVLDFITEGLSFGANVVFQKESFASKQFSVVPAKYTLDPNYYQNNIYSLIQTNGDLISSFPEYEDASSVNSSISGTGYEFNVRYNRIFGDHVVNAYTLYDGQEFKNKNPSQIDDSDPQKYKNFATNVGYGYKNRYFFEATFAESGNMRAVEDYITSQSFSAGVAYIISEEDFIKENIDFLNLLKFRASYGYVYNNGTMEGTMHQWDIPETMNVGADIRLFDNLTISADYFREMRDYSTFRYEDVMDSVGTKVDSLLYRTNFTKYETRGFEISANYHKVFSEDFWVMVGGNVSYNKTVYNHIRTYEEDTPLDHKSNLGHDISQRIGYIDNGIFSDYYEISKAPAMSGTQPGDIRYRDINNDFAINTNDIVHIGLPTVPRYTYGFNGAVHYKGFEFSFSFQGVGETSLFVDPAMITPFTGDGSGVLSAIADSYWSPKNMVDNAFWPRVNVAGIGQYDPTTGNDGLQTVSIPNSTFFMYNGAYLRCRHIELSYTVPTTLLSKYGLKSIRVYGRADNPFVISEFNVWDPELGANGFSYPIQKSYSLGISLSF